MTQPSKDTLPGFLYALTAYLLWGFLPFYMKAVKDIPVAEVIAHRILWSLPIAFAVLAWQGRIGALAEVLRTPARLKYALASAALISVNWGIYVWSIGSGHALDAALGYYINPLFSIFLGAVLLKERLAPAQLAAIALAALAVGLLTFEAGRLPLAALGLTVSWGFYAYFKRQMPIGANEGFALEVLILTPPALAYLAYALLQGTAHFGGEAGSTVLLLGAGLVTAVPLMVYANGAKGLRLSTIGIMQYIAPSMILVIALVFFGETLGTAQIAAFALIWAALVLYTGAMLHASRISGRET
jgi:chloramphenicol-sensitive protein RarD